MAILTISRQIGTGGLQIGRTIADEMGYVLLDKKRGLQDLNTDGVTWKKLGEEMDEHVPSLWERYDWRYWAFVALTKSHILERALAGNVVIMSRGGNFLLDGIAHVLRIRIIAPMEKRAALVTEDQSGSVFSSSNVVSARKILEKADKEGEALVRSIFDKDWNDPKAYDLTINMGSVSVDEAIEALKMMLVKRDRLQDEKAVNLLKYRFLAAKIHATIATNPLFLVPTLEVFPSSEGSIVLKGVVHNAKEHKLIEDEAKKIAGTVPVECELHYR
jgi:cytidylate kinase